MWDISQKYGVDFEEVKQLNSHLSSPDMIMPGMKIKVPSSTKSVKHESKPAKETKKEQVKKPYKDISPKPKPVIKEDDKKPPKKVQPEMPKMPQMPVQPIIQMPVLDQDFEHHTTVKFPQMPKQPEPKKEKPKEKPVKQEKKAEAMPPQPMPMPMVPCYMVHPCCPPAPYPMMAPHHMPPMGKHVKKDCGCQGTGGMHDQHMMPYMMGEHMPHYGVAPAYRHPSDYTQQQQPPGYPSHQQQSNLYPPPFSMDMNQAYPHPPGYPQHHYRNDEEQTDNEE